MPVIALIVYPQFPIYHNPEYSAKPHCFIIHTSTRSYVNIRQDVANALNGLLMSRRSCTQTLQCNKMSLLFFKSCTGFKSLYIFIVQTMPVSSVLKHADFIHHISIFVTLIQQRLQHHLQEHK